MHLAVGGDAKYAGEVVLAEFRFQPKRRVGEVDAAVGAGDGVVGFVQPLALPPFGDGRDRAVGVHAGDAAVAGAFAHHQAPLEVEGAAVAFAGILAQH